MSKTSDLAQDVMTQVKLTVCNMASFVTDLTSVTMLCYQCSLAPAGSNDFMINDYFINSGLSKSNCLCV